MFISIITVTWNNSKTIVKQIESVKKGAGDIEFEEIIVDNASTDNTVEIIKKYPEIKLIQNKENLGFGAANNQAYKIASGEFILFLNPDNELEENSLEKLISKMESDKTIGLLSPKLINSDGTYNKNAGPRRFPKLTDQLALLLKIPHLFPKVLDHYLMKDFDPETEQEVDSVRGAFMLLRKSTLDKLGFGFDPRYFIWFEDVDLCREIKKMGLKIIYFPLLTSIDLIGQSFKQQNSLWKQKIFTKSMLLYFKKWERFYIWIPIAFFRPIAIFIVWLTSIRKK
jgi:GT2 family glycosyltransferase